MRGPKSYMSAVPAGNVDARRVLNALENNGFSGTGALAALDAAMQSHPTGTKYRFLQEIGKSPGAEDVDVDPVNGAAIQIRQDASSPGVYIVNITRKGLSRSGDPLSRPTEVIPRDTRRNDWRRPASQSA